jgi:hypothetical protein
MFGKLAIGAGKLSSKGLHGKNHSPVDGLAVALEQHVLVLSKRHMFPDVALIPADALDHSQKPRPDGAVVDAALTEFRLQKFERFAAEAIKEHVLENVPDVVVPAEMVNEIVAE